jgi:hypothetical protein
VRCDDDDVKLEMYLRVRHDEGPVLSDVSTFDVSLVEPLDRLSLSLLVPTIELPLPFALPPWPTSPQPSTGKLPHPSPSLSASLASSAPPSLASSTLSHLHQ